MQSFLLGKIWEVGVKPKQTLSEISWILNAASRGRSVQTMGNCFNTGYVDIRRINTTGADETAELNHLPPGAASSHIMAERDLMRIHKYRAVIKNVAHEKDIDPAVIAAIISRDSQGQIQENVNLVDYLSNVTVKLADHIEAIRYKFPKWTKEQQVKGGIAAYKVGTKNVHSYEYVDEYTDGKDYSNDVVARAQWFKANMYF